MLLNKQCLRAIHALSAEFSQTPSHQSFCKFANGIGDSAGYEAEQQWRDAVAIVERVCVGWS